MSNERFFLIVCYDIANDTVNIKIYHVTGFESMASFFCAVVMNSVSYKDIWNTLGVKRPNHFPLNPHTQALAYYLT